MGVSDPFLGIQTKHMEGGHPLAFDLISSAILIHLKGVPPESSTTRIRIPTRQPVHQTLQRAWRCIAIHCRCRTATWNTCITCFCSRSPLGSVAGSRRLGIFAAVIKLSIFFFWHVLELPSHPWRVFTSFPYLLSGWAVRARCTGVLGGCWCFAGDCSMRSPFFVHHDRPYLGRCDFKRTCRL